MDPAGKTLVDIASVSRRVLDTLVRHAGHKTVESFQFEKIVVASGAILETLNGALFLVGRGTVDDRLLDWLSGEEPERCLEILNRMEALLGPKLEHRQGFKSFFQSSRSMSAKDRSNEAIKHFLKHEGYFHFLLSTEIWNHESAHVDQRKVGDPASKAQERNPRKRGVDAKKLSAILRWLHAWNCNETYERILLLRQPDTCIWLLNTNAYKTWRTRKIPGAGKSVLSAFVIDDLKGSLQDGEVLAYFYCDFRNERSTNAAEVMRSLLSQLLQRFHHRALDPGDLIDELIERKDGGASTISNVILLARYISRAAKQFDQQPFLVVDALDECTDGGSRLFVTSRPLQVIKDGLSGSVSIDMDMMKYEVSADISLHVRRVLDSHRRLRIMHTSLKNEMYSVLCEKADAMFRWVQCQLSSLEQCMTAIQVREVLNNLPSNLHETYERILLKMSEDEREGKVVRRALDWLVVALSPLRLSQVMEGLSIDLDRRVLDCACGPVHGPALLDVLGSLVTYNEVTDIVILSHFSVKEYLTSHSTRTCHPAHYKLALLCMCYITIYLEHGRLSGVYEAPLQNTCEAGIRYQVSPLSPSPQFGSLDEYVLSHGFRHLSHINPGNRAVLCAIRILHLNAQRHPLEWDRLCRRSYSLNSLWPTLKHDFMLYILIAYAPASSLRSFIGRAQLKLKDGTNPLVYAAGFGRMEHAQILLSSLNIYYSDHRRLLPLEAAVERCDPRSPVPHKIFVDALSRDCELPACTDEFTEWAHVQDEGLLLRALDPTRYVVATFELSQQDIDVIQRRFVQLGYDPSTRFNTTSLRHAVSAGHISTVQHMLSLNIPLPPDIILEASVSPTPGAAMIRLCLEKGSDVHAVSPTEDTPLHRAQSRYPQIAEDDRLESVRVLIDAGCYPSRCNLAGETPLHLAVRNGYLSVAEHLLPLHVPLPPDILLAASESRNAAMIRLLTSKGADVHAIAANGDTPLHRVLQDPWDRSEERLDCIKVLIHSGCNPGVRNVHGKTPFDVAAENGRLSVVQCLHSTLLNSPFPPNILLSVAGVESPERTPVIKFLISKGADIHVTRPNGDSLLHLTMTDMINPWETECLTRIKILVNAGCNPHACNLAGETPFHIAARQGYALIMEYLLLLGISVPLDMMTSQFKGAKYNIAQRCSSVRFLLDQGGDVHTVAKNGDTLLHLAATLYPERDALELAKRLVDAGCNPSALNSKQDTPLHVAARHGSISFMEYLLSLDIELPPDILLPASTSCSNRAKLIRYLIQEGASVCVSTADGDNPLHLLLTTTEEEDILECVKILIDAGCDSRAKNVSGETPLHRVARRGYRTVLEYFLSEGTTLPHDILLASETVTTLLCLLDRGLDLRSVAAEDATKLMHRVLDTSDRMENDVVAYAQILIRRAGWDPLLKSSAGDTAIHVAARRGRMDAVQFFLSQHVPLPPDVLLAAVPGVQGWNHYHAVPLTRFFIREGASVHVVASNGETPLHLVMMYGFPSDKDKPSSSSFKRGMSWQVVEILLNAGSDPHARNANGQTPLDLAEAKGHFFKENFLRLVRNAHPDRLRF
ncbi:ankyrin repeat-containing domain protein [Boletus edulis BED1]|uniref:Ankyrin repeat-containing domain protein n=1 Tax=Boletus edulis BED1 TaxID=1328754 RepID=A0AAD4C8S1_BOLED|nr:ankyrin repeat-containing domain protein [Boletus edulis BED1]